MSRKKLLYCLVVAAVLIIVTVAALTSLNRGEMKSTLYGFFLIGMYVLLIASYLSRFALVLFGVFAVYKVLQERQKACNTSG